MGNNCCKENTTITPSRNIEENGIWFKDLQKKEELTEFQYGSERVSSGYSSASSRLTASTRPSTSQSQNADPRLNTYKQTSHNAKETLLDKTEGSKACLRNNNPNNNFEEESKRKLKRNFLYLKKELDPDYLLDYFIQDEIFTPDEEETVRQAGCRRNQADVFLRLLLRPSKISSYPAFLRILGDTKCGHIRTKLESESTESNLPDYKDFDTTTFTSEVYKLQGELVRDPGDPTRIAEYFLQHEVFSLDEYENIIQEKNKQA